MCEVFRSDPDHYQVPVNSATLAGPQQLEQNLLSRNPAQIAQTGAVSGSLWSRSTPTDASPAVRDLMILQTQPQGSAEESDRIDALADWNFRPRQLNQSIQKCSARKCRSRSPGRRLAREGQCLYAIATVT